MEKLVDARGLNCPQPVIFTKEALEKIECGIVTVIIDNEVAKDNIIRLAKKFDYPIEITKEEEAFYIKIRKEVTMKKQLDTAAGTVLLMSSEFFGKGSDELGKVLSKSLFFTLLETEPILQSIIFLNSGVKLVCEDSHILEEIIELEKKGVEILSCGTCLEYFHLKNKLCVGSISNMYVIVEKLLNNRTLNL